MLTKIWPKLTLVTSKRKLSALKRRRACKNRLPLLERLDGRQMLAGDTLSLLIPSIMQKSFSVSDVPAIRAELFAQGNNLPANGGVIQRPDGKITWEQYTGSFVDPRSSSSTQVFVNGYVMDLENPSIERNRVCGVEDGWSSTHYEYRNNGGLPDWVRNNFVAAVGEKDMSIPVFRA